MRKLAIFLTIAAALAAVAWTAGDPIPGLSTTDQTVGLPASAINEHAIPLGTDKASSSPRVGYLDRCGGVPVGGPPVSTPPWVNTAARTWDATKKVAVAGDVTWKASFTAKHVGSQEVLTGNGLPAESGTFPVARSDPAYRYAPDPTAVFAHHISLKLPYNPTQAGATCENGIVGIATNGIPLLDGFDAGGNDAAAVEVQDACHGHPNQIVGYHYHGLSPCLVTGAARTHTTLVGWALDGFGIYVEYDAKGRLLTNAALDACHGRTSVVPWHGKSVRVYHYDLTIEFPYSVGCFRGHPVSAAGLTTQSGPPAPSAGG